MHSAIETLLNKKILELASYELASLHLEYNELLPYYILPLDPRIPICIVMEAPC